MATRHLTITAKIEYFYCKLTDSWGGTVPSDWAKLADLISGPYAELAFLVRVRRVNPRHFETDYAIGFRYLIQSMPPIWSDWSLTIIATATHIWGNALGCLEWDTANGEASIEYIYYGDRLEVRAMGQTANYDISPSASYSLGFTLYASSNPRGLSCNFDLPSNAGTYISGTYGQWKLIGNHLEMITTGAVKVGFTAMATIPHIELHSIPSSLGSLVINQTPENLALLTPYANDPGDCKNFYLNIATGSRAGIIKPPAVQTGTLVFSWDGESEVSLSAGEDWMGFIGPGGTAILHSWESRALRLCGIHLLQPWESYLWDKGWKLISSLEYFKQEKDLYSAFHNKFDQWGTSFKVSTNPIDYSWGGTNVGIKVEANYPVVRYKSNNPPIIGNHIPTFFGSAWCVLGEWGTNIIDNEYNQCILAGGNEDICAKCFPSINDYQLFQEEIPVEKPAVEDLPFKLIFQARSPLTDRKTVGRSFVYTGTARLFIHGCLWDKATEGLLYANIPDWSGPLPGGQSIVPQFWVIDPKDIRKAELGYFYEINNSPRTKSLQTDLLINGGKIFISFPVGTTIFLPYSFNFISNDTLPLKVKHPTEDTTWGAASFSLLNPYILIDKGIMVGGERRLARITNDEAVQVYREPGEKKLRLEALGGSSFATQVHTRGSFAIFKPQIEVKVLDGLSLAKRHFNNNMVIDNYGTYHYGYQAMSGFPLGSNNYKLLKYDGLTEEESSEFWVDWVLENKEVLQQSAIYSSVEYKNKENLAYLNFAWEWQNQIFICSHSNDNSIINTYTIYPDYSGYELSGSYAVGTDIITGARIINDVILIDKSYRAYKWVNGTLIYLNDIETPPIPKKKFNLFVIPLVTNQAIQFYWIGSTISVNTCVYNGNSISSVRWENSIGTLRGIATGVSARGGRDWRYFRVLTRGVEAATWESWDAKSFFRTFPPPD